MSGTTTPVACGRTLAAMTGRAGSKPGSARLISRYSSRMPRRRPKWASRHSPRAPSPCSTIVSIARCADARSVTATSSGHRKCSSVAWAFGRPDEQALGAEPICQVLQAGLDRPVELADRVELLQVRDDLVLLVVRQRNGLRDRLEPLGILDVHPLGPLEEGEMAERGLAEGQQLDPDAGRVAVGRHREVRTGKARGGADGGQQVLDERQVEHLLLADGQQRLAPALDRGEGLGRQSFARRSA